jgi:hypothetical protein
MSSFSAACFKTGDVATLVDYFEHWLSLEYGHATREERDADTFVGSQFLDGKPTEVAIGALSSGVILARFNAFTGGHDGHEPWLCELTQRLSCRAAVIQWQTVASYGYAAIYENGRRLRLIEGGDDGLLRSDGRPLRFEEDFFDAEDEEEASTSYLTDPDRIEDYCAAAGVDIAGEVTSKLTVLRAAK